MRGRMRYIRHFLSFCAFESDILSTLRRNKKRWRGTLSNRRGQWSRWTWSALRKGKRLSLLGPTSRRFSLYLRHVRDVAIIYGIKIVHEFTILSFGMKTKLTFYALFYCLLWRQRVFEDGPENRNTGEQININLFEWFTLSIFSFTSGYNWKRKLYISTYNFFILKICVKA